MCEMINKYGKTKREIKEAAMDLSFMGKGVMESWVTWKVATRKEARTQTDLGQQKRNRGGLERERRKPGPERRTKGEMARHSLSEDYGGPGTI